MLRRTIECTAILAFDVGRARRREEGWLREGKMAGEGEEGE